MKPLVFDLYCGLGGWSEAFIAQGYRAVGFDVEAHNYGNGGYPGELVLRDVRSLTGAELVKHYGTPACIVASPPCQFFSYCAMPWSRAKALMKEVESDAAKRAQATDLFNQCFRIQREVSEAAGRYVPLIIENVRGAQKWVGRARWNFGSFYLWGDVPALMPIPGKKVLKDGVTHRSDGEGNKTAGMNWSDQSKRGQNFTRIAGRQAEGVKGFTPHGQPLGKNELCKMHGSARKEASAIIAKIPPALADWIAMWFSPHCQFAKTADLFPIALTKD